MDYNKDTVIFENAPVVNFDYYGNESDYRFRYRRYIKKYDAYAYIYSIYDDDDNGLITQCYNIPDCKDPEEVNFVIMIGNLCNQVTFDFTLGHELGHIDLMHLTYKNQRHVYGHRYIPAECYCDMVAFEKLKTDYEREYMLKQFCKIKKRLEDRGCSKDISREYEARINMMRLFIKKKITASMVADYIDRSYEIHIDELEKNIERWDKFESGLRMHKIRFDEEYFDRKDEARNRIYNKLYF